MRPPDSTPVTTVAVGRLCDVTESPTLPWAAHANGVLITARECSELIGKHAVPPTTVREDTWRRYQSRWREAGLIPAPKATYGRTHVYDQGEVTWWATHRPGQGARRDLPPQRPERRGDPDPSS